MQIYKNTRIMVSIFICFFFINCSQLENSSFTPSSYIEQKNDNKNGVIIFVHGIFGDAKATWTNNDTKAYFPEMVKNDSLFSGYNIFTYGYPSPMFKKSFNINDLAEDLRNDFDTYNLWDYKNIIFVSHSMGGLVTRKFLLKYAANKNLASKTKLLFFFATPSNGSNIAKWAKVISPNPTLQNMTEDQGEGYLGDMMKDWKANQVLANIASYGAYEVLETKGIIVVDQNSSLNLTNRWVTPINSNHTDIVKPRDNKEKPFTSFVNAVKNEKLDVDNNATFQLSSIFSNREGGDIEKFINYSGMKAYYYQSNCDSTLTESNSQNITDYLIFLDKHIGYERELNKLSNKIKISLSPNNDSLYILCHPLLTGKINYFSFNFKNTFISDLIGDFGENLIRNNDTTNESLHKGMFYYTGNNKLDSFILSFKIKK